MEEWIKQKQKQITEVLKKEPVLISAIPAKNEAKIQVVIRESEMLGSVIIAAETGAMVGFALAKLGAYKIETLYSPTRAILLASIKKDE